MTEAVRRVSVHVTTTDLYEVARQLWPGSPVELRADDGTVIVLRAAWGDVEGDSNA